MMKRKFYAGTIMVVYVSEESLDGWTVERILEACDSGPAIAGPMTQKERQITRKAADQLALKYGSDEAFFDTGVMP